MYSSNVHMMKSCQNRIEFTVFQLILFVFILIVCIFAAITGWFRTIEPRTYEQSHKYNRVKSIIHTDEQSSPFLYDLGEPPKLYQSQSYIQWTFLQMNDVYELISLGGGKKGGLARVATIRQLLLKENSNTITVLSGDVVSPSALGNSVVNGSKLNGKQMIATLNVLGLDYATLGNHEFDLQEGSLRRRLNESRFQWIASNVYEYNTTKPFHNVLPYKIVTIADVRILLIGLTIDDNFGPPGAVPYVTITSQRTLPEFTAEFLKHLRDELNLKWDVVICLTHLNMQNDIEVVEHNLNIDALMGGHEHENYYLKRGSKYTPIYKADDNVFSVYIHRFAYQPETKQLLIFSKLAQVTPKFEEEPKTAAVANYFYQAGLQSFRDKGYFPERVVCVLPTGFFLDGRSAIIRSQQTHLTQALCNAMMNVTNTTICVFNSGAIRIDDQLVGTITQYDILRCLPFATDIISLRVNTSTLVKVLNRGLMNINTGMFTSYAGVEYDPASEKWYLQSNRQALDDDHSMLTMTSIPYFVDNTELKYASENVILYKRLTAAFIEYLENVYGRTTNRNS